jgi:putative transposase
MPRHARLRIPGHPWHVIQRGVNRSACFFDDADRRIYLALLRIHASRHGCAIHAYVLMGNHVHLLATPTEDTSVSRMMKAVGERYVRYFNRKHGRTGTLWEGRFRSSIVQSEAYLFECQRYIELNPTRAKLVSHPKDYRWSSYPANASGSPCGLVTPHDLYLAMSSSRIERAEAYQALFGEFREPEDKIRFIREATNGGFAIADRAFVHRLQQTTDIPVARRARGRRRRRNSPENENGAEVFRPAGKSGLSLFK